MERLIPGYDADLLLNGHGISLRNGTAQMYLVTTITVD